MRRSQTASQVQALCPQVAAALLKQRAFAGAARASHLTTKRAQRCQVLLQIHDKSQINMRVSSLWSNHMRPVDLAPLRRERSLRAALGELLLSHNCVAIIYLETPYQ